MSENDKVTPATATPVAEAKKTRRPNPKSILCILQEDKEDATKLNTVKDKIEEEDLPKAVAELPFGEYILRRYTDRPLTKKEIKRDRVTIG